MRIWTGVRWRREGSQKPKNDRTSRVADLVNVSESSASLVSRDVVWTLAQALCGELRAGHGAWVSYH